ncbi:MAG: hypothetical protein KDE48_23355 [Anaerolineales bacterium]|nr:hypothetical protein [Anaerolineales bacterium]
MMQSRLLNYQLALIPNPELLLIDDLVKGLSLRARHDLLEFINRSAVSQQRTIIYATNDLTILQTLKANSIWGRGEQHTWCKWPEAITNSAVYQAAAFEFVFVTSQQAEQFHQKLQQYPNHFGLVNDFQPGHVGNRIKIQVNHPDRLVDLILAAGNALIDFQIHPIHPHELPKLRSLDPCELALPDYYNGDLIPPARITLSLTQKWRALWQIGRSEWRRHFRGFWKIGNLLFSSIFTLLFLLIFSSSLQQAAQIDLALAAGAMLAAAATMSVVWGVEGLNWMTSAVIHFQADRAEVRTRPYTNISLPPLLPFDFSPLGRKGLLTGLLLGHSATAITHAALFWIFWIMLFPNPVFLIISCGFWLLLAGAAWALALFLGRFAHTSEGYLLLGILAYAGILTTTAALISTPAAVEPFTWFWPFTGYIVAFSALSSDYVNMNRVFWPLTVATVATTIIWWTAARYFLNKPPIINLEDNE